MPLAGDGPSVLDAREPLAIVAFMLNVQHLCIYKGGFCASMSSAATASTISTMPLLVLSYINLQVCDADYNDYVVAGSRLHTRYNYSNVYMTEPSHNTRLISTS
ncbi:uncharacterized protein MCYG_08480 [Microsporum canis CBS 113480]|uniref:Uncharacterized protein n=1 Tax=Arthroderma otae (strain ATCC MYA-4605 / CBS 113480) TaxID=554155 RepID=C5G0K8_ARTOC|nr:uncharacterized protein MCYG_08480 [Microsporum canis CBS 113480]EEQ35661.1 predicted protein [Microsporum canis CBS 113480]